MATVFSRTPVADPGLRLYASTSSLIIPGEFPGPAVDGSRNVELRQVEVDPFWSLMAFGLVRLLTPSTPDWTDLEQPFPVTSICPAGSVPGSL